MTSQNVWKENMNHLDKIIYLGCHREYKFQGFFFPTGNVRKTSRGPLACWLGVELIPRSLLLRPPLTIVETLGGLGWRLQCRPWENVIDVCLAFNSLFTGWENSRPLSPLRKNTSKEIINISKSEMKAFRWKNRENTKAIHYYML